ncbi:MAG: hypothetical protein WCF67_18165 [Chitinophagaceae bacterium]
MRRLFCLLLIIFVKAVVAQDVEFNNLRIPVSPAFAILDISPTSIERPTNPKALAANVLNFVGSGSVLPKNFALELSPYWVLKHKNETVYKFLGIESAKDKPGVSTGFLRKMDISVATFFNDSAKNFLSNTNYTGFGVRTNLITIWGVTRANELRDLLVARAKERTDLITASPNLTVDEIEEQLKKTRQGKETNRKSSDIKPLLAIDASYAYSDAYFNNKYENKRFNRRALWLNGSLNMEVNKEDKDYFFITAHFKRMKDNVLTDTAHSIFNEQSVNDLGIRAGYERGSFSISIEHLSRKYDDVSDLDSRRTVGILQFKVNENLYLFGTFGKNFGQMNTLFTLFGLNWGWGKNNVPIK